VFILLQQLIWAEERSVFLMRYFSHSDRTRADVTVRPLPGRVRFR